ncbi:MAG: TraR/DksA family transcriptional regulator [Acidobacteriota bacterium]|nr:TraR/DksA family transcriptional regulator [Acidobacteriota bacterium]
METRTQGMTDERYSELRSILEERCDEIAGEVKHKIRNVRTEATQAGMHRLADTSETSESDIQDDIEFALLQMKAETLTKISAALTRLEEGTYGYCYKCGDEIAEQRLRALPFAARCRECEEVRETELNRERVLESRTKAESLFGITSI